MTHRSVTLRRAAGWHRPLMILVAAMAVLTLVTAVGVVADDRVVTGAPVWLKPFKFSVSIVLYGLTLAWMLSLLPPGRTRLAGRAAVVIAAMLVVEMVVIVGQAARGRTSHYNEATPLDAILWQFMSVAIMVLFVAHFLLGFAVLRSRLADRASATAVRLGLALALLGMLAAVPMVVPSAAQVAAGIAGAHSVGIADGGPGLPVVGWSTVGGDLRIGHFVGLHGLQALPLLGLLLSRYGRRLTERTRVGLLLVAGGGYAGLTGLLTWQALRGQPLLRPDAVTLAAAVVLAAATLTAAAVVLRRERRADLELELAA
jgi:hypothetical protein